MTRRLKAVCLTALVGLMVVAMASSSQLAAQDQAAGKPAATKQPNAVGAQQGWKPTIDGSSSGGVSGRTFDENQLKLIGKINGYFNKMTNLQGRFLQSTSDNQKSKGKFYVKRPGKFRFSYAPPSLLVILSNGRFLFVQDLDLNTTDQYPLDSTPFRLLLGENVDILRDSQIIDLFEAEKLVALTMRDKSGEAPGTIKLFFSKDEAGGLTLTEWVITDAQGVDTRIQVANLVTGKKVDPKLFQPSKATFPTDN